MVSEEQTLNREHTNDDDDDKDNDDDGDDNDDDDDGGGDVKNNMSKRDEARCCQGLNPGADVHGMRSKLRGAKPGLERPDRRFCPSRARIPGTHQASTCEFPKAPLIADSAPPGHDEAMLRPTSSS